jgi:class 3 adenylate cyclase
VIRRYHACIAQTVTRFDGFVAQYLGDGALVYFGYPQAHEDDAEPAGRGGLALVDAVGGLQAPERLQVRIGIATGLVVVGDPLGAGSAHERAIVGNTPNLAARLQALAEQSGVIVAKSTRRQIGALFEFADLGPQSLKGFAEPQHAWRVLAENLALGRFEGLRSAPRRSSAELRNWTCCSAARGRRRQAVGVWC